MTPSIYGYERIGSFVIPGKCKSKSNEKLPNGRLSKEMRDWEDAVALIARVAIPKAKSNLGWIVLYPSFENKVHPDLSNLPKSVFDAVVKAGIFKDDKNVACTVLPALYGKPSNTIVEVWEKAPDAR